MSAFLFGKLPAHGDFVARGMGVGEREALDDWLAGSLADARASLTRFEELYDQAPPWRFAWRDANGWAAGAIAPSVDGAGRRFPVLLGRGGLSPDRIEGAALAAEELLYDALGHGWEADRLQAALVAAVTPLSEPWAGGEAWWTLGGERFTENRLAGARPAGLMRAMLTPVGESDGEA